MALVMAAGLAVMFNNSRSSTSTKIVALLLLLSGLWNALWYGLRHLGEFWGHAGLVTGFAMLLAAFYLWLNRSGDQSKTVFKVLVTGALALSFALYFISLVQLNLGYEIIR